ncbi:MAG: penicillin-binding protein 2, partial [Vulcanococcus sp.]
MVEVQVRRRAGRHRRVVTLSAVPAARLWLVFALLAAGLAGLAVRLAWVQVVQGPDLQQRARAVQTQTITPIGKRRTIVDRQGRLVALDEERFTLWAHPRYFAFAGD